MPTPLEVAADALIAVMDRAFSQAQMVRNAALNEQPSEVRHYADQMARVPQDLAQRLEELRRALDQGR